MVPQPSHILRDLLRDALHILRRDLIIGAGKHEVLPHQKPLLVTQVVEIIPRINAAAPDADHIEVGVHTHLQERICLLAAHPCQNIVFRDIVRPHGKERPPVHFHGKCLAPAVRLSFHRDSPKTDPPDDSFSCPVRFRGVSPRTARLAALPVNPGEIPREILKDRFHLIQRLPAQPVWPPQLWIRHRERDTVLQGIHFPGRRGQVNGQAVLQRITGIRRFLRAGVSLRLHTDSQFRLRPTRARRLPSVLGLIDLNSFLCADLLVNSHLFDPRVIPADECYVSPDSLVRKARPPVPSEHEVRLSKMRKALHTLPRSAQMVLSILLADIFCRRRDRDNEAVIQWAQNL